MPDSAPVVHASPPAPVNPTTERLSFLEKFGFGVGDLASNLLFQTFNMFLLFFYTDVVGLGTTAIFWIFAVAKIWDMINDPIMGAIADRTRSRWGRYRPYIFLLAIPYGETRSYGEIARAIGQPDAARGVGAANAANPIALVVPCHRVIGADGSLTGYGGGLPLKKALLAHEAEHRSPSPGTLL